MIFAPRPSTRKTRRMINALLGATALVSATVPAAAQDAGDLIVMRRVVSEPKPTIRRPLHPVEGADMSTYHWEASDWFGMKAQCTADGEQGRLLGCVLNGRQVPDDQCPKPKPDAARPGANYSACGYKWEAIGSIGEWSSTCSTNARREIDYRCVRQDGETAEEFYCAGQQREKYETGANLTDCSYQWSVGDYGPWADQCSDDTRRTRSVTCRRSDGNTVSESFCTKDRPSAHEDGVNRAGCGQDAKPYWLAGAWSAPSSTCSSSATQTRESTCRNPDGSETDAAACTGAKPEGRRQVESYAGCTYEWSVGDYGDWSSTCSSSATKTRSVQCRRSDGASAFDTSCGGDKPATQQTAEITTSCTYAWKAGEWKTAGGCTANSPSTRTVQCLRSDGTPADETSCAAQDRPAATQQLPDYSQCTFSWATSDYSPWSTTCGAGATRSREIHCQRSDLTPADASSCTGSPPDASETADVYTGCSTYWKPGEWSAWSSTCSATSTRTRSAQCIKRYPTGDAPTKVEECDASQKPSSQETRED